MKYPHPPTYRRYTCNIECPQVKCRNCTVTDTLYVTNLNVNGNTFNGGTSASSTGHIITYQELPALSGENAYFIGELTVYVSNQTSKMGIAKYVIYRRGASTDLLVTQLTRITELNTLECIPFSNYLQINTSEGTILTWTYNGI